MKRNEGKFRLFYGKDGIKTAVYNGLTLAKVGQNYVK